MSHKKTLFQLPLFWMMFLFPIVVGGCVAVLIVSHDFYFTGPACWTSECINDGVIRLKVPITIMALVFPAVALIASWHRSAQTAAQIERTDKQIAATEGKNAFENCIKHREIFFKRLNELEGQYKVKFVRPDQLYSSIFIRNDYEGFEVYVGLDHFRKVFFDFNKKKTPQKKIHSIRLILQNKIHIKYVSVSDSDSAKLMADDALAVDLYEKLVDDFADFCLSPNDRIEVFSNDLDSIRDVYY